MTKFIKTNMYGLFLWLFYFFLKFFVCHVEAVQDDISASIWLKYSMLVVDGCWSLAWVCYLLFTFIITSVRIKARDKLNIPGKIRWPWSSGKVTPVYATVQYSLFRSYQKNMVMYIWSPLTGLPNTLMWKFLTIMCPNSVNMLRFYGLKLKKFSWIFYLTFS